MGTAAADGKWISRVPVGAGWTGDFPVQGPQRFDNAPLIGAAFASRFSLLGTASAFDLDPAWSSSDDIRISCRPAPCTEIQLGLRESIL